MFDVRSHYMFVHKSEAPGGDAILEPTLIPCVIECNRQQPGRISGMAAITQVVLSLALAFFSVNNVPVCIVLSHRGFQRHCYTVMLMK
jgi:hypothetical protein